MKPNRSPIFTTAFAILACLAVALMTPPAEAQAQRLSAGEIEQLQEKLESLKKVIENRYSQLNSNAGDVFLNASGNADAAVELYFRCHKIVNYDREERDEKEFEDWKDGQRDRVKDPRFLEGLMTQLRYLALSCKAAEAESLEEIFPSLLAYSEGLMRLTEMPSQTLLQDISGSIFAEAYHLDELLKENQSWEMVPFNISGIYEKTVLPYLRENEPEKLMGAWDRRIAQQGQMVEFLEALENRGNRRDDRKRSENEVRQMQGGRTGGIIKAHDRDDFVRDTLPQLKLGKLIDMFQYVDQSQGASGMVAFIEENIEHENAHDWLELIAGVLAAGRRTPDPVPTPAAPPVTATPPPSATPAPGAKGTTSGKVPPGLVPVD